MSTFCQICRHPTPGHEPNCPVGNQTPVRGMAGINPQDMQPMPQGGLMSAAYQTPCPYCGGYGGNHMWAEAGGCPGAATYGQSDQDTRILAGIADIRSELTRIRKLLEDKLK